MKIKIMYYSFMFALLILTSCSSDEKTLGVGDKVQHDDFFYSVEKVSTSNAIGDKKTNGLYYIITFKV